MASFFKKALGGNANTYIDQAVDQAAVIAKDKAKSLMTNSGDKKKGQGGSSSSSGGGAPPAQKPTPVEQPQHTEGGGTGEGSADITDDLFNIAGELDGGK